MKLKVTLERAGTPSVDLAVTCPATATVGELAAYLARADPTRHRISGTVQVLPGVTLSVAGSTRRLLDARTLILDSGLRSGDVVSISRGGEAFRDASQAGVATLAVLEGPDTGAEFPLFSGSNIVGRSRSCDVRLTDRLVSREHVRLNVTREIDAIDLGSVNGLTVNDAPTVRTVVKPSDRLSIGDTTFTVRLTTSTAAQGRTEGSAVGFIRSPNLIKPFTGSVVDAPEVPERVERMRFPWLTILAPVILALALFAFTSSLTSLLFLALSPIMLIGSFFEQRWSGRAANRAKEALFRSDVAALVQEGEQTAVIEVAARLVEHPAPSECLDAVRVLSPTVWMRRSDSPGMGQVRLGLGELPSRSTVVLPDAKRGPRDLHAELRAAIAHLTVVAPVPVVAEFAHEGAVGVAGPRSASLSVARALLLQLVALHSPADLVVTCVASSRTGQDWDWLKWLPHCPSAMSPLAGDHLASGATGAAELISEVEALLAARSSAKSSAPSLPLVVLVVESDAPVDFARLTGLAEAGWHHGIFVLWVASEVTSLPAACRVFVEVRSLDGGQVGFLHTGELVSPVRVEPISGVDALAAARRLSPLVDLAARVEDESDLPRSVSFLALHGADLASSPAAVIERWQATRSVLTGPCAPEAPAYKAGTLRAIIGQSAGAEHAVDLRADGPHALVGGTTGSGKSELLQTWILALAASHSPQRLTFLLVDYKGGSAFADCNDLPHTVGLVTDLNPNGVHRALTSLKAELVRRERYLRAHRAKDLMEVEKRGRADAPPSLVIVVDEFAALVGEVPEFIDGVVDIAQRGRSLGLHLVLATQSPSGVIKGSLRANTNLRLALRVADIDESMDVLGSADAAYFDQDRPGRAVSKTGPGRLVPFQTAYAGGHTDAAPPRSEFDVRELGFGVAAVWEDDIGDAEAPVSELGPADITRVVATITAAHAAARLPIPHRPWLPDLRPVYDLADQRLLPSRRRDDELVFAMQDIPKEQEQRPVAFHPDRDGNLVVFGAGGSGKTTLLRSLAVAAGFTVRGGPCHVYGLDFGARGLSVLEHLPHVGSIIVGADEERVRRLLTWLRQLIDDRALRYSRVNAGSITQYRRLADAPDEPRILFLVDGIGAFRQAYEAGSLTAVWDLFLTIAADGRQVGVHLVATADRPGALSTALASSIQRRLVLRMADPGDYSTIGVPSDILSAASPPGRGILDGVETQVAILGSHADTTSQAAALVAFGGAIRDSGAAAAPPIRSLPDRISASSLPADSGGLPVIGVGSDDLQPCSVSPSGTFLIAGPPGSGRSTAFVAVATALRRWAPATTLVLLAPRRSSVTSLGLWTHQAVGESAVATLATELAAQIRVRADADGPGAVTVALFLENVPDFSGGDAESALSDLLRACDVAEVFVVSEGEASAVTSGYGLLGQLKASRAGIALQPDPMDGLSLFKTDFPGRLKRADFPPGRGLLVRRGGVRVVQVMLPDS